MASKLEMSLTHTRKQSHPQMHRNGEKLCFQNCAPIFPTTHGT
ncbi:TPA: hypothetical protein N0F65_007321 [Lagenidium giganteum]|uniref:Uncharacterized protein n=1 Tax=Lagenidium giganteum TaxID=4803 RepID=A0AAV2Z7P9_9STRA|nr:TPA: hypothetical protein N0F65_007321 [Lagenidium giganteum]